MIIGGRLPGFVAGAAAAVAVWVVVWPTDESVPREAPTEVQRVVRPSTLASGDLASWLLDLENAPDADARVKAAERIGHLPGSAFPDAMESVTLVKDGRVTLPARVLLNRWAAVDGEAAINWAWLNARSSGRWAKVLGEMVPGWAWHRPHELAEWTRRQVEALHNQPGRGLTMSSAEVEATDLPVFETTDFRTIGHALAKVEPRLGFEVLLFSRSIGSDSSVLVASLRSVEEVREALSAFDCLEAMEPWKAHGDDQIVAHSLLGRWKDLDPDHFAKSPHAHLVPDHFPQPELRELPPVVREHQEWDREFQQWRNSNRRDGRLDTSGWSAAKRQAWEDLEALRGDR